MDEIAKIAHKAKGSLYYHFHSKEELFTEVVKNEMNNLKVQLTKIINNKDLKAIEKLKQYIIVRMNTIEHAANYNETVRADFFEYFDFIDDLRESIDKWEKHQLRFIIDQGIEEDIFRQPVDFEVALETMVMLLKGMEVSYFLKESPVKNLPPVEKVAEILINGFSK